MSKQSMADVYSKKVMHTGSLFDNVEESSSSQRKVHQRSEQQVSILEMYAEANTNKKTSVNESSHKNILLVESLQNIKKLIETDSVAATREVNRLLNTLKG